MIKNKKNCFFLFKRKTCDEDEKIVSTSTKLEKLHENPRIEENKKTSLKFLMYENSLKRDS